MQKIRPALLLLWMLAGCVGGVPETKLALTRTNFDDIPGWQSDQQSEALPALARSCAVLVKKTDAVKPACTALAQIPSHDDGAAREFFERYFEPYAVNDGDKDEGLFTGYYEAELRGSLHKTKRYHVPLYARPRDLVDVDLGVFQPAWKGKHIAGKVTKNHLVLYDDRAAIASKGLHNRAHILLWVDNEVDAFFLAIQGSGRVRLPNGRYVRVGYDGANGRSYVAIGRVLLDKGEIEKPVTMQKIRAWLVAHANQAPEIMNLNPSYVFFRRLKGDGPIGAEGIALTPRRSLAVDPAFVKYGSVLWLDTTDGADDPLQRLMVAQDTGGAIKGPVRGDFFWGAGAQAETQAGAMQSKGTYYLLLPKASNAGN